METNSIKVMIPPGRFPEREYIVDVIFTEILGQKYILETWDYNFSAILIFDSYGDAKEIRIDDVFLGVSNEAWLKKQSLASLNISFIGVDEPNLDYSSYFSDIPVLFGRNEIAVFEDQVSCGIDIFGTCFFLLTRYEELLVDDLDSHGRFPLEGSVLHDSGLFKRPIVNEYCNLLKCMIQKLVPEVTFQQKRFQKYISCDVDFPVDRAGSSLFRTIKRVGARIVRDRSVKLACTDSLSLLFRLFNSYRFDFCLNNLLYIAEINSKYGNSVNFNLIPVITNEKYDNAIDFSSNYAAELIDAIILNGHTIGFHPGYDSYDDSEVFTHSFDALQRRMEAYDYSVDSGRNHYLRYKVGVTPQLWESIGATTDSTLGFAESPGFRSSVCSAYTMFDLVERRKLKLKQQPLIVMDVALQNTESRKRYFNSMPAVDIFRLFEDIVMFYCGDLTVLWHNDNIVDRNLYERIVC